MPDGHGAPSAPPADQRGQPQAMWQRASFAPSTFNAEARTVDVVFTTGADVQRYDWMTGRNFIERLVVTPEAVDLSRLNAGAPVLNTHGTWALEDVLGVVERAWIEGGQGRATIRFSDREAVAPIVRDVQTGILRNISAGYWVQEWRITKPEDGGTEVREAVRWLPGEISLVPVPADAGSQVRTAADTQPAPAAASSTPPALPANPEEIRMADVNTQPGGQPGNPQADAADQVATARQEAAEAETARIRGIQIAATQLGRPEAEAAELVRSGASLETAQARMIEAAAAARASQPMPGHAAVNVLSDEGDTNRRALTDALLHRCGLLRDANGQQLPLPDAARQYRGFRMIEFAAETLHMRGGKTRGMLPAEIARAALGDREMIARAGIGFHSLSDFPNLLANTSSKALGMGYTSARRTFTAWARRRTLPDFKSFRVVNLGGAPSLATISPTGADAGEIQFGTIGEGAESYQLFRAGRRVSVTFEAIVNDDMDGFSRIPQMFGAAAARLESDTVYGILNSNPNMADATALFAAGHTNIFGNGVAGFSAGDGVLDVTGLGVGRRVLRTQTAPNGDILDLEPVVLLVPAALEARALQFTSMSYVAAAPGSINPYAGSLTPVVEPRLASAVQWYLIASNDQVDTVEYAYLEGMEAPQITTYTDEDTDGVIVKCTHSFGAKATDWRGMARASGT